MCACSQRPEEELLGDMAFREEIGNSTCTLPMRKTKNDDDTENEPLEGVVKGPLPFILLQQPPKNMDNPGSAQQNNRRRSRRLSTGSYLRWAGNLFFTYIERFCDLNSDHKHIWNTVKVLLESVLVNLVNFQP